MAKAKFNVEVGALYRSKIRTSLNNAKADILYEDPNANVQVIESKGFLESEFRFVVTNCKDTTVTAVQDYCYKLKLLS